jgi:hypothetical protein
LFLVALRRKGEREGNEIREIRQKRERDKNGQEFFLKQFVYRERHCDNKPWTMDMKMVDFLCPARVLDNFEP